MDKNLVAKASINVSAPRNKSCNALVNSEVRLSGKVGGKASRIKTKVWFFSSKVVGKTGKQAE